LEKEIITASLSTKKRIAIIADTAISSQAETLKKDLQAELLLFSGGEAAKTRENKERFEDALLKKQFGRDTLLIGMGGGVVTDFTAFLASTYMRGVALFLIPTTLLAMVDAAIGGKTGVDTSFGKNQIGTIYQPDCIFVDMAYLKTLPDKEWISGLSEILKYGLIADSEIWELIEQNPSKWKEHISSFILSSIRIKTKVVQEDPLEQKGFRRILNFGHTVAHALETLSSYTMSHGEAVAMGLIAESFLSFHLGFLPKKEFERIETLIRKFPYQFKLPKAFASFLSAMQIDKKAKMGIPRFVLIDRIGHTLPFDGAYCKSVAETALKALSHWMESNYV